MAVITSGCDRAVRAADDRQEGGRALEAVRYRVAEGALQLQSLWMNPTAAVRCLTAAIPVDNPYRSCTLTQG